MNIFEQATRKALRFSSPQGDLSVEDLWNLPLKTEKLTRASLNQVAQAVDSQLTVSQTKNFVDDATPLALADTLKLDVVKHIISVKKAENEAKVAAVARVAQKQKLLGLLAEKQDAELKGLSTEEILAKIEALG